jgi:RNA polymerase sigma factor (sigma-70 family)
MARGKRSSSMAVNDTFGNRGRFEPTHWSLVLSAAGGSRHALEELCSAYWQPLYCYVRRMGYDSADAQDLTQSFFARLLEKQVLGFADRERGRFRTFLLTALRRFVINEWKRDRSDRRGGGRRALSINFDATENEGVLEPSHNLTPDSLFERRWAIQVLENSVARLRQQQQAAEKGQRFDELALLLTPWADAPSYQETSERLGTTTAAVKMAVSRLRKELGRLVREEVRKTVASDTEVEDELQRLITALRVEG